MQKAPPGKPTILIILDGFGVNPSRQNNGVLEADTPRLDHYFGHYPHTVLEASGRAVGLPDGQMGNSEVGHLTIGGGAIYRQHLVRIDDAIRDGSFFGNAALTTAAARAAESGQPLHLLGMVSDGGVHSHLRHLLALVELARRAGARPLVHMITDGRDTAPQCAGNFVPDLEEAVLAAGGAIASICGRYYAMDRDKRWERTAEAFAAYTQGEGRKAPDATSAISDAHTAGEGDEFIRPTLLSGFEAIATGQEVIFFNFRNDRTRQLSEALFRREFSGFDRGNFNPVSLTTFTEYDRSYGLPYAFDPEVPATNLAEVVSNAGLEQFHCAETEKYAHVTFFLNGGREEPYAGEERQVIPSPKVATYDLKPEMSAHEVTDAVIAAIEADRYGFIVVNYANGDMVGHTAVREAILKAVEALDTEVGRLLDVTREAGYAAILTADHGNCEEMVDPVSGKPQTQHSVYPVPCLIVDDTAWRLTTGAGLSALAPTVLQLMGLEQPAAMSGESVLLGVQMAAS